MLSRTGFIHMNGRVYDPRIGRFVSPDPIVQAPHFSQSYNRYAYVFNNPLSYTDPSGYAVESQQVVSFAVTAIASGLGVPPPVAALIGAFVGALFGGDTGSASTGTGAATGGGFASGGSRGASGGGGGGNSKDGSPPPAIQLLVSSRRGIGVGRGIQRMACKGQTLSMKLSFHE